MGSKTLSVSDAAYRHLHEAKLRRDESFSQVILRAQWVNVAPTAGDLLRRLQARETILAVNLDEIEAAKALDSPAEDKWRESSF